MKVTVTFGQTGVVVPCKDGWTVRDLIQQATLRYRKLLEQEGDFLVRTHHVEYCDGGILDPDDVLSDLVEDKDKLMAVYEEQEAQQRGVANSSLTPSPDLYQSELSVFQPIAGGEIEVNSSALKSNTPLLVRSSSDSALGPQSAEAQPSLSEDHTVMGGSPDAERPAGVDRSLAKHTSGGSLTRLVEILGEDSPLGIHVVPYCSSLSGRSLGLYIRGVEEESRSRKEGLFQEDECIVRINTMDLMDKTFGQAQEVFRHAMHSPIVRLEVVPSENRERYERSLIGSLFADGSGPNSSPHVAREAPPPIKAKPAYRPSENPCFRLAEDVAALEVAVATPRSSSESPLMKKSSALASLVSNKKGGRRLRIDLKKGSEGLGFTVVTRDSSVHGPGPILVKNILPRGAAIKDGRLQSGDRILEVNGVDITGVGQEELVCMLRSTRQGESVCLVVLRQDDMFLPREMKDELSSLPASFVSESGKEQLTFEVPLNDSGSAGLGISLKGNKSRETGEDLGIFIKSIIHGGAAYKDGRLRVNDQLVAVNGESLLGCSNHMAMETLRRSMSQEGNLRGTIQLVVLRVQKDGVSPNRSFDDSSGLPGLNGHLVLNNSPSSFNVTNGSCHMDEVEDGELYRRGSDLHSSSLHSYLQDRENARTSSPAQPQCPPNNHNQSQRQFQHVKASKSMDLGTTQNQQPTVADESNMASFAGSPAAAAAAPAAPVELGPTLGLKKSSSLESLQTAMAEANRGNDFLPFHRPRQNMVRGRGCNESFRAAIDKSYDGPPEDDDDDGSDLSSGRDTPASNSSRQGAGDRTEEKSKKDKKKKTKTKKKEKNKGKGKEKEKKKAEEPEETEKKSKKIGFGLLRFGKKKDEKKEAKAAQQKSDLLSDHELQRMKDERERIEATHAELRDQQHQAGGGNGGGSAYQDADDDDADPNYARIQPFRERNMGSPPPLPPQSPPYAATQHALARTPSPRGPSPFAGHGGPGGDPAAGQDDDPLDKLYAKVNKPRPTGPTSPPTSTAANDSVDRIQQLRREYQLARREGMVPPYEELDFRRRGLENDMHRQMPGRATDHRLAPRYDEVERQYASLPRRGPLDPAEYSMQPWTGHYPGPPPQGYSQSPAYHNNNHQPGPPYTSYPPGQPYTRPADPRAVDSGYYSHQSPPQRGPLRQDVPPSPTPPLRGLRYDTMMRGAGGGAYR